MVSRVRIIIYLSFLTFQYANGQNLIPNPSFEKRHNLFYSQRLFLLSNWKSPNNGIPWLIRREKNWFGSQTAYSGENYILIEYGHVKYGSVDYELYGCVQAKLKSKLDSGEFYCIELQSSLADNYNYAVPNLQVGFSNQKIKQKESALAIKTDRLLQLKHHNLLLDDRMNWTRNCAYFVSNGSEKFIQIGFLNENTTMVKIPVNSDHIIQVGYFIDEVSLKKVNDSSSCICQSRLPNEPKVDSVESLLESTIKKPFNFNPNSIYFGIDSFGLSEVAKWEIENLTTFLNQNQNISIQVLGHTDSTGSQKHNIKLSEWRAQAVINALIEQGIQPNRLHLYIMESKQPLGDNSTKKGRELNRRVSFKVLP
jgi:outer membrane protein OmpA-like peptidoglycan-associated protein